MSNILTETLVDENGIELLVSYKSQKSASQLEDYSGSRYEVGNAIDVSITGVELVIKGTGINIMSSLTKRQLQHLTSSLEIMD